MPNPLTYVLVTPARNEARFIEATIQSVVAQTALPLRWVIVSDGSTDATDEIVGRYAAQHDWIELLRMPERKERHFGGKALALTAGKERCDDLGYDVIAALDADITFDKEYFAFLLEKLASDPALGIVGTPYEEKTGEIFNYEFTSLDHVSGACQVFRRECYDSIGGYVPVKVGTIDCIAVISARMKGWKTRTFTEKISQHGRITGTAQASPMKANFKTGVMDYVMGNHPLWQMFRAVYQMTKKPYFLRGIAVGTGYVWTSIQGVERPVTREFVRFHQQEQMQRLKNKIASFSGSTGPATTSSELRETR